jgi:hypothetical protein
MCSIAKGATSFGQGQRVKTAVGGGVALGLGLPNWISFVGSYVVAAVVGRYVWMHTTTRRPGVVRHIVLGAVTTGGIGFAAGFFGPILFMPGANQGPLLGILITGPLGFLLGAIGGAVYWFTRIRQAGELPVSGTS